MAEKKKFLLRIDERLYASLEKWASDDFRSINAQIEYLLQDALRKAGRINNSSGDLQNKSPDSNQDNN
ncbi:MAG: Arc family DNA-binding protein [Melioribacteraceae bacterium]|nr:Arc family DNA-binding protein [Melioribacteraceae bacterium]